MNDQTHPEPRPHVRLRTGRPVSQYAGNEGCAGLGPFLYYPDELEPTSSPNTRRKIVSTCLRW